MIKKIIIGAFAALVSSGALFWNSAPDGLLHVYILDIGQGDAIFIQTPGGKRLLVDGGPQKTVLTELNEVLPFFNRKIDYVVSTHTDKDHIEGLLYVMRQYDVGAAVFTGAYKKNYLSETFFKIINEKNIPVIIADDKSDLTFHDGVLFDILYPFKPSIGEQENPNDFSIVAKVIYGTNEILLTGDAETASEEKILRAGIDVHADVLKVGHHGSKTSTSEAFLRAVKPEYSAISVGKNNTYHHPHPSVLRRLQDSKQKILRTDEKGRIEFVFSKTGLVKVETEK